MWVLGTLCAQKGGGTFWRFGPEDMKEMFHTAPPGTSAHQMVRPLLWKPAHVWEAGGGLCVLEGGSVLSLGS